MIIRYTGYVPSRIGDYYYYYDLLHGYIPWGQKAIYRDNHQDRKRIRENRTFKTSRQLNNAIKAILKNLQK
jgi:hypothetical protein